MGNLKVFTKKQHYKVQPLLLMLFETSMIIDDIRQVKAFFHQGKKQNTEAYIRGGILEFLLERNSSPATTNQIFNY